MAGALNSVLEYEEAEGKKQSEHPLYFSQLIVFAEESTFSLHESFCFAARLYGARQ